MSYRVLFGILGTLLLVISFQNCQEAFVPTENGINNINSETPGGPVASKPAFTFSTYATCKANVGLDNLAACAAKNSEAPEALTQELVNTCISNVGTSDLWVASCLTKNSVPVHGYRELKQWDIETCNLAVGADKLQACLWKNAILPVDLKQDGIDSCIGAVGLNNVEQCLRKRGYLRTRANLAQYDINVCLVVSGQDKLALCLYNSELLPGVATQDDLDSCQATVGTDKISACLRRQKFIPDSLQQGLISSCAEDVGQQNIAGCLAVNGFSPEGLTQDEVDDCIGKVSVQGISKCLRTKNILSQVPDTDDLYLCEAAVGQENIVACLDKNGLKTATLEQIYLNTCIQNVGIDGAVGCLKVNGYLPRALSFLMLAEEVLGANCVSCHSGSSPAAGFDITNYDELLARVSPGDLNSSVLYQKMTNVNNPMPKSGLLEDKLIRQVEAWILHGAWNN